MFEKLPPPKRILLIEPPFFKLFGYKRWHYPIGLTVVGTYLEELGHVVKILDADRPTADCREYNRTEAGDNYYKYSEALEKLDHPEWMQINAVVEEFKPDIVGISASISAKIDSANIIAKNIKQKYRDKVLTVLGGTHVNVMRSMYPDYDFGDYYDEVSLYIADIFDRRPNKKLLIDYQHYAPESFCSVWTSMGCPNACTFCCYSGNRKVLFRSIDNIRSELIDIRKEYNNAFPVYFLDDSFISYNKRFYEITEISRGLGLKFKAGGHVMDLSPEKIETFIKNGGLRIYIGIESGSQRVLDKIK
ncbi:MAG: cobalamin-dependent protein, partial [Candidatus Omnitrophica bacterium]|nr:cobalamin-dependent protein [Candidatus Omnitrophota bacterium]